MARYKVTLAYDGTDFLGFQRQAKGRTVQGGVESALSKIGWQGASILSAGRTDTGVHASGQVVAFDLDWAHSLDELQAALNAVLPFDIAVRQVEVVSQDFHPRYAARSRRYLYHIYCQAERDPLRERYAWRIWPAPVLERLSEAAGCLIGTHNFAAFGTPPLPGGSTSRTIVKASWRQDRDNLFFEIASQAFLYHMVRRLVFFQVLIGQGQLEVGELGQLLASEQQDIMLVQGLAPAHGLELVEVNYLENAASVRN